MPRRARARLTIPDVVYLLMTVAVIGALWPVVRAGLEKQASTISTGAGFLFLLILPLGTIVVLVLGYRAALGGVAR